MSIPIIRMEIEGLKQHIAKMVPMFDGHTDSDVQDAMKACFANGNVTRMINSAVEGAINSVIRESVYEYFTSGEGRAVIHQATMDAMRRHFTEPKETE